MISWVSAMLAAAALTALMPQPPVSQTADAGERDRRVRAFLDRHRNDWHDLNVPEIDGRTLHELILKHRYQRAVEIGTSTGHSGVWIAWALSKTGGKLVTIDIDARRHAIAVANFREAGLADYIDARLGNAHEIVPASKGRSTSCSRMRTRSGTRGIWRRYGRSSGRAAASPRTMSRAPG